MDPIVVVLVVAASVVLAEQVCLLVGDRLGDETAARAGHLWAPHRLVDLAGTVLVPAVLAVIGPGSLVSFGWARRGTVRPAGLDGAAGVVVALTAPVMHLLLAALGMALSALTSGVASDVGVLALHTNLLAATFLLLPFPSLPGGRLIGRVLPAEPGARWESRARWSRAVVGIPAAMVVGYAVQRASGLTLLG